jgi:cleavage and polyadenylation specificity factor subunit 1
MDGSLPRAKIKSCSICDPSVLILREDESISLFIGKTEQGKIQRKDMSPMGDKVLLISSTLCSKLLIASM